MPCGWEGNHGFGVALAMRDFSCLSTYGLTAYGREMSTPPTLIVGYGTLYLTCCDNVGLLHCSLQRAGRVVSV